jgi:nicotinamide-nucleotide amidase
VNIELINTGSELMLGRVVNSHQSWICRELAGWGCVVTRQVAVGDSAPDIRAAVRDALGRADLVLVTGGLGPTADDLTRDVIAELLGKKLREDPLIVARIEEFFAQRQRPMPPRTRVQALVPDGARVLANAHGTAPGLFMEASPNPFRPGGEKSWVVMLPGPPRELRPMFTEQLIPLLRQKLPPPTAFACRTLKTTGLGESLVEESIAGSLQQLTAAGLEVGYCAQVGAVEVRLLARGGEAQTTVAQAEQIVRARIGQHIFGENDDQLETVVVRLLMEQRRTLATAESCTGGQLANRVTNVPGASAVFRCGWVTYSNEAKAQLLGVDGATLAVHGAVSEAVARAMAEGARQRGDVDYALAVTGIAGPTGGTKEKPVGTVFIALAVDGNTVVLNPVNPYDRETFKYVTSQQALELLRRSLLGEISA